MGSLAVGLSVSGTVLPREGQTPLLAVSAQLGDTVVQAAVIDPERESDLAEALAPEHWQSV